jgi:hypothetical protein
VKLLAEWTKSIVQNTITNPTSDVEKSEQEQASTGTSLPDTECITTESTGGPSTVPVRA